MLILNSYPLILIIDFNSKINLELNVILKQSNILTGFVQNEKKDTNVENTATYLILLLASRKNFIEEGMRLAQELIDSGYDRNNEALIGHETHPENMLRKRLPWHPTQNYTKICIHIV
jgi:hypothetical protein